MACIGCGSGNEGGCGLIVHVARLERYNKGFTSMGCVFKTRGSKRDLCGSEVPVRRSAVLEERERLPSKPNNEDPPPASRRLSY